MMVRGNQRISRNKRKGRGAWHLEFESDNGGARHNTSSLMWPRVLGFGEKNGAEKHMRIFGGCFHGQRARKMDEVEEIFPDCVRGGTPIAMLILTTEVHLSTK
jgi:hypothetical protein